MQQLTPAYILNRVASSTFRKDFFDYIFSENDNASWQKELEKRLAKIINYREKKFKKLPQAEKTRLLVRRIGVHKLKGPLVDALTGFVIEQRRFLLTKFLDQCEVEHDLGVVEIGTQPPSVGIALSVLRSLSKDTVHIDELKALCAVGSISKSEEGWQDMFRECYVRLDLPEEPVQRKKSNQDAEVESEQKQSEAPTQASSATSKT
ncbi:MAG: hypothetical protein U5N86_05870, partial [Planctomycetota bacterium]|nr:hypothetical protein [Planctomycetota bacterium]